MKNGNKISIIVLVTMLLATTLMVSSQASTMNVKLNVNAPEYVNEGDFFRAIVSCDNIPVENAEISFAGSIYFTDNEGTALLKAPLVEQNEELMILAHKMGYEAGVTVIKIVNTIPIIVHVDDDFDMNTPGWNYDCFDSIQNGIDAVDEGGTVNVYNGIYYEHVVIDKTIDLIGEDKSSTIIDNSEDNNVVEITADGVIFRGFTILNGSLDGMRLYEVSNNLIIDNIIKNNKYGICLLRSSQNIVTDNILFDNTGDGIRLLQSTDTEIFYNEIFKNSGGVYLGWLSKNNYVSNNNIFGNDIGIGLMKSIHNFMGDNIIYNNGIGIFLYQSKYNFISENTISGSKDWGIRTYGKYTDFNRVSRNNFIDNLQNAYDKHNNYYNDSTMGNYWGDYEGTDNDGDGIGDTPYMIPEGNNMDYYPLMTPFKPSP